MSDTKTTELSTHGNENPDEALRQGVSRAGETVENIKRAYTCKRVVLRGDGWLGGDGVQLQLSTPIKR